MTLTPGQLSTLRRRLEEAADDDAKKQAGVFTFTLFDLSVQLTIARESSAVIVDEVVDREIGEDVALSLDDSQLRLLSLYYIRRRINVEIDRLEELAIDLRVENVP